MRAKKLKIKEEDLVRRYQDLLEIARLVSWCMNLSALRVRSCNITFQKVRVLNLYPLKLVNFLEKK